MTPHPEHHQSNVTSHLPTRHPIVTEDLESILAHQLPWSQLGGKTILITGAYGFLAAYVVETLLLLNERLARPLTKVIALVRDKEKALLRFRHYVGRPDLEFVVQDVAEQIKYPGEIHYIIHAASKASPKYYNSEALDILGANVFGTQNILQLAHEKQVENVLFFSTSEVYGQVSDLAEAIGESSFGSLDPTDLRSCYAESKRLGETMCLAWFHRFAIPTVIVRPFHTYGPGMDLRDGRVFADFVADVVAQRDITLRSDGSAKRAFCYISDATAGIFTLLLKGVPGQAYNLGNPNAEISIRGLANLLVGMFPERGLRVLLPNQKSDKYLHNPIPRMRPDIGKISQLGWNPNVGLGEGFRRTVFSYEAP